MHFGEQLDEAGPKPGMGSRDAARGRRFRRKRTVTPGISSALHASRSLGPTCHRGFLPWLVLQFCQDLESFARPVAFFHIRGCGKITIISRPFPAGAPAMMRVS